MSELQIDDPDPLPTYGGYRMNYETGLVYEGNDLSADLAEQERASFEREAITSLSNYTSRVVESTYGVGSQTERRAILGETEVYRKIVDSAWIFGIIDTDNGVRRCRAWVLGGDGVSWCDDEERYEPAGDVLERLKSTFPLEDEKAEKVSSARLGVRRMLARIGLRS